MSCAGTVRPCGPGAGMMCPTRPLTPRARSCSSSLRASCWPPCVPGVQWCVSANPLDRRAAADGLLTMAGACRPAVGNGRSRGHRQWRASGQRPGLCAQQWAVGPGCLPVPAGARACARARAGRGRRPLAGTRRGRPRRPAQVVCACCGCGPPLDNMAWRNCCAPRVPAALQLAARAAGLLGACNARIGAGCFRVFTRKRRAI